jgi:hypothetical protein
MTNVCSVVQCARREWVVVWSTLGRCLALGPLRPVRDFRASGAPLCLWSKAQGA